MKSTRYLAPVTNGSEPNHRQQHSSRTGKSHLQTYGVGRLNKDLIKVLDLGA